MAALPTFPSPVAEDNEIFRNLAGLFIGEELLSELPTAPLDSQALDYSVDSLRAVDSYLSDVRTSGGTDEQMFRLIVRAGSYVGEVLRYQSASALSWMRYERAPEAIDAITGGLGEHPAAMGVLVTQSGQAMQPLGKVHRFLQDPQGESMHALALTTKD